MIKLKINLHFYLVPVLGFLIFILHPCQKAFALEKVKGQEFLLIYFTHPRIETVVPIRKYNLAESSSHELLIGNQKHVKTAIVMVDKILAEREDHTNKDFSYFLGIDFYDKNGNHDAIYLDKNRNFIFEGLDGEDTMGRVPERLFDKLVEFCDPFADVIDMVYLRERVAQPKKEFEPMIYSSKKNGERNKGKSK